MEILHNPSYLETIIKKCNIASCFEDISRFQAGLKLIRFPKGTYLYSRPEHRRYAYFLITGKLQIHATMENGRQMLVRCCDEFIFFGDMELLGYQTSSNMTETMTECLFLALDITRGKAELLEDKKFLRFLCNSLAEKISYFADIQFRNRANTPREKVAVHLLQSADERGYFKENLRKTAEFLAVSYRHLHRILREFVEKGALVRAEGGYLIADRKLLEEAGEEKNREKE